MDVRCADLLEAFTHDAVCKIGFVAFTAQMGKVKVFQSGGHDLRNSFSGGIVGKMAVPAKNALLETPRAADGILQHFYVVIGLQDEDVCAPRALEHELGNVTEVGDETHIAGAGVQ